MSEVDVAIVGGGLSGLSLAWRLQQSAPQYSVVVLEASDRLGGNITTQAAEGFVWELGPNSFAPTPALLQLIAELGLQSELIRGDRHLPRYIYWRGHLYPLEPTRPLALATSNLLSPWGKVRAALGALGFVPPYLGSGDESVHSFFRRHLGQEVAERLVAPFVSGVYAGDPQQLSAAAAFRRIAQLEKLGGSLIAGALRLRRQQAPKPKPPTGVQMRPGELGSFKEGLAVLPRAIAQQLKAPIHLQTPVQEITPESKGGYLLRSGEQTWHARSVVLATPAYQTAELVAPFQPAIARVLATIPYPTVACVVLAYPAGLGRSVRPGFGVLIPRGQGIRTLGTIWSSCLFPQRTPAGWQVFTSFIGGATDPDLASLSEETIVQQVQQDLSRLLDLPAAKARLLGMKVWRRAIPQYIVGYPEQWQQVTHALSQTPGLFLCSNYAEGVALGDRVEHGNRTAAAVAAYLSGGQP
ncbi:MULTISPECIES: protoporphyrinogen oxidase [unclassified Thermosynechococcus]|uniref:protoporphyrinogen oxidase n=1 Tax=unclassified Thermosynechococcus TaxID=2622553 RepID=UPI002672E13C|nr:MULTISPECIES: protoporphyrinogen oxidase [unclassified Thermosynechococcus]MDR5638606.1 protoporphyrinogen oxidase [Thermosynechococcus sp. PP42]MDR7899123.1 protoporphyrinogen oxidase [Thermosynechococcus sp. JY1332]MDR7906530.1 protoporphyrinogen oxidase [Thermosynechococcus sp. JY1334]MDR7921426.1 protoporphyrinogen oxidase [Thermosynechococcus sp. HY213]MDR7994352.1 protoporphyrinogen oxidase [Thermosynechococcus sp. TG252]